MQYLLHQFHIMNLNHDMTCLQTNISSKIKFLPYWMKCWNGLHNYKIYKVLKKKKKIMLDDVG